jgi:hypothetical protein
MSNDVFYVKDKQKYVSPSELQAMVRSGIVRPNDKVVSADGRREFPASEFMNVPRWFSNENSMPTRPANFGFDPPKPIRNDVASEENIVATKTKQGRTADYGVIKADVAPNGNAINIQPGSCDPLNDFGCFDTSKDKGGGSSLFEQSSQYATEEPGMSEREKTAYKMGVDVGYQAGLAKNPVVELPFQNQQGLVSPISGQPVRVVSSFGDL